MDMFDFKMSSIEAHWVKVVFCGWLFFLIVIFIFIYPSLHNKLFGIIPSTIFGAIASVYLVGFPYRMFLNIKIYERRKEKAKETLLCFLCFLGLTLAWYWVWKARDLL